MSEKSYVEGFQAKCAEYGVDPEVLVKASAFTGVPPMPVLKAAIKSFIAGSTRPGLLQKSIKLPGGDALVKRMKVDGPTIYFDPRNLASYLGGQLTSAGAGIGAAGYGGKKLYDKLRDE